MPRLFEATFESVRMLSFLTLVGLTTLAVAPLTGCDQKSGTPGPVVPADDTPADDMPANNDIKINAPGVDVEIDRSPEGTGRPEVDVDVLPRTGGGVDVDVDRDPVTGPNVDVDVDPK